MSENKDRSVKDPDLLNRESTHRLLNFLNLLNSMVRLKTADHHSTEVRELGDEISAYIDCFSRLHTLLIEPGNEGRIATDVFLPRLSDTLRTFPLVAEKNIRIEKQVESLELPGSHILPLSLITIESFINSLKYAFPEEMQDSIREDQQEDLPGTRFFRIDFSHNHTSAKLSLRDNGIGLDTGDAMGTRRGTSGKGFQIMHALAGQIGAHMEITEARGTRVDIHIPLESTADSAGGSLSR